MTILEAMADPALFGSFFAPGASWEAWRAFLAALFALPMTEDQCTVYAACTGRAAAPMWRVPHECWCIVGRRGGKSRIAATVAVYLAAFRDYRHILAPGERGTLPIIAADRKQARTVLRYVNGLLNGCPLLAALIENRRAEAVDLTNGITIEVHTASFRSVRGYTVVSCVLDEVAFWRSDDSANPDREIVAALRPAMATVPGALLLAISSPYARRGALWDAYRQHYAQDGDSVLVWKADTRSMNPTVPAHVVEEALAEDEAAARAEYLAEFRRDIESFIAREAVEAVVIPGRRELPPVPGVSYVAFVDPSGGSADAMTLAIAHPELRGEVSVAVLDVVREVRPPFSPEAVVQEFAELLRQYRVTSVRGDRYAGEWPRERFRVHGIAYRVSDRSKGELYGAFLPAVNSGRVELLDNARLAAQLCGLERRATRGGRDSIDHPPLGHDDLANVVAGALVAASARGRQLQPFERRDIRERRDILARREILAR